MFKTTNGGSNWTPANTVLTSFQVYTLVINPTTPDTLYAGTTGGGVLVTTFGRIWDVFLPLVLRN